MQERDIYGEALLDYQYGKSMEDITTYLKLPGFQQPIVDTFSLAYLFRSFAEMPALEQQALHHCRGKILDIGCGAGSHSLYLQDKGLDVTAMDISEGAVVTCRERGLLKVVHTSVEYFGGTKFDTILLLMNGIGMTGRLRDLPEFLDLLKSLLATNGQILVDSSDIRYMYQEDEDGTFHIPETTPYYGEGRFVMEYQGNKGREFPWLYLEYERLKNSAAGQGLNCQLICRGEHYDYLARLQKSGH